MFNDLKREETAKNEVVQKLTNEFENSVNGYFTQLKAIDSENEKMLREFAEHFKKEAALIFEAILKENQAIELTEPKIQSLVKEILDKANVD